MEKRIEGKVYVLSDNIDTDQIIPAEYLSFNPSIPEERKMFGRYALSGVPKERAGLPSGNIDFVNEGEIKSKYTIIVAGKNFGCGSSREHAPLALAEAGVRVVVANSFARIFFRNSINGGYLIPIETDTPLWKEIRTNDDLIIDLENYILEDKTSGKSYKLKPLGEVEEIISAGGLFKYAKKMQSM